MRVVRIGKEVSERLEYTPAMLKVLQHARLKDRCELEKGASIISTAWAQPSPQASSNAGLRLRPGLPCS